MIAIKKYLNPIDAGFLRLESQRTPMHVGALLTFRLPDDAPSTFLQDLFAYMRSVPVNTPPFNYRLARGLPSLLRPAWEEARYIDIDYHLRHSALPYPGGERELGVLVARLHSNPIDMSRPLWECHLIEGLENRRFAFYLKTHHAMVDGIGGLNLLRRWLSTDPKHNTPTGPWATPAAPVSEPNEETGDEPELSQGLFEHVMDRARSRVHSFSELYDVLGSLSGTPKGSGRDGMLSPLATPRTLFNVPISQQRRLATQLFELKRFKAISAETGATVNDIAMTICGGAMRRYLIELDALPTNSLVASVPLGLPRTDGKEGNAVAGFVCPLATDESNPLERLARIGLMTKRAKEQLRALSPEALGELTLLGMAPLMLGQMAGVTRWLPPLFNVVVSNVIGSTQKLYFCGAELEAIYPVSVLFDGYALNITVVGYADRVAIGVAGCRNALPRLQRLAVYTGEALDELEKALQGGRRH